MFGWGKNKKQKSKSNVKPRPAPAAHRHPPYKKNAPHPPTAAAQRRPNNRAQPAQPAQPQQSHSQHITPRRQLQSNAQTQNKPPASNPNPTANDPSEDESDDMFADMDMNDSDDPQNETSQTPQKPQTRSKRTMSVEELAALSDEQRLTLALSMSMGTTDDTQQSKATNPISKNGSQITHTITKKSEQISQPTVQQISDPSKIEWPSMPTGTDNSTEQIANIQRKEQGQSSAFGFDLNSSANPTDNINGNGNANIATENNGNTTSAFGFELSGTATATNETVNDGDDEDGDMFDNMHISKKEEDDNISSIMAASNSNYTTKSSEHATPSYTSQLTASPPPSASLGPVDASVSSQLKRAESQHERSRKRIWSQIKQCLEREQRIKERETELRERLIVENSKKASAESNKLTALKNADFELAEKTKNIIRRSMKNITDVDRQLSKYDADIKKIVSDKAIEEDKYVKKNKVYRDKLKLLYDKHEQTMSVTIDDEFKRIEREEKKFKEKLDRTEREIQLDEENIEKCKEKMEEIEDLIRTDVEPYQENLDRKNNDKSCLLLEIEELNKQLQLKKEELLAVESSIAGLNTEIGKVRKIYSDQTDEILSEQARFEQSKDKFEMQKNEYLINIHGLNDDNLTNKRNETEFEDELHALKLKISKINDSVERSEQKKQRHSEWISEEQRLLENHQKLNKKVGDIKYEIERYEKELKQIDSKCIQHRSTVSTIDSALPILHSDKTTAVNNENYLEAGKIHKQILHKTQQKEKSAEQLRGLNEKTMRIKEKLRTEQDSCAQIKKELSDIKIKVHKQRFDLIVDQRYIIKEGLEGSILEESDLENVVLNLELNQIELELQFFRKQYGWDVSAKSKERSVSVSQSVERNGISDAISMVSPNNAEEYSDMKVREARAERRSRDEIEGELQSVKEEILGKESENSEVQSEINKAVVNDDYVKAGELAPKKKKLIAEISELNARVEKLRIELGECEEREEKEETTEEILAANEGLNGIISAEKEENKTDNTNENEVIEKLTDTINEENMNNVSENNLEMENVTENEEIKTENIDETEQEKITEDAIVDSKPNEGNEQRSEEEEEEDMFGDMDMGEDDTIDIN